MPIGLYVAWNVDGVIPDLEAPLTKSSSMLSPDHLKFSSNDYKKLLTPILVPPRIIAPRIIPTWIEIMHGIIPTSFVFV